MATDRKDQPPRERRAAAGYEERDASTSWILSIIAGLFLALIGAEYLMNRTVARLETRPLPTDRWSGAGPAATSAWAQAVFPRLQVSSPEDLRRLRAHEDAELTTYGWINRTEGVVRIPIDRAMDLLSQRGLPVRAAIGESRLGPTPFELQQQRTNSTKPETRLPR